MIFILGIIILLVCLLALSLHKAEHMSCEAISDDEVSEYYDRVNLRKKINISDNFEFQKQKSAKILPKCMAVSLGYQGKIVGIICNGFYVLEKRDGQLLCVCSKCAQKAVDFQKTENPNGSYDLFLMNRSLTVVEMKPDTDRGYDFIKLPFTGNKPICEMLPCVMQDS